MIVLYLKENNQFLQAIPNFPEVVEDGNKLCFPDGKVIINDLTKAGWGYYKDKYIERQYDEDEMELPIYMDDLDLEPMDADDLPKSMHIAALMSVSMVNGSPRGTVVRKYLGENYTLENCRVSQSAYDNYQAGKIKVYDTNYGVNAPENKDSFVLVYFISENPYDEEIEIPVIVDKVVK